jgi:hypothetical protein
MQRLQLYIEDNDGNYPLVDLFDDESIQLTSTIQDVRDIGKVFTDYSQTFTVPASETNNKIFRHYYDYYITGNAYDSRKKKNARLEINYLPFRRGKIFLNSVKMKMNKAYAYELIFYGETVSLKDLIGDDELTDLTYLQNFNHLYDRDTVLSGLKNGIDFLIDGTIYNDSVIYPLITSKKRLFYNSDDPVSSSDLNSSGNLYHKASQPDGIRGLEYTDLKPAIKLIHIIEAIEAQYSISFTRDFFNGDLDVNLDPKSPAFYNLYMWVNNKKGEINDIDDDEQYLFSHFVSGYTFSSGLQPPVTFDGSIFTISQSGAGWTIELDIDVVTPINNIKYTVLFTNLTTGAVVEKNLIGDSIVNATFLPPEQGTTSFNEEIQIKILSEEALTINSIDATFNYVPLVGTSIIGNYSTDTNETTTTELSFQNRMPKMKVLDFLTGLFKVFNLTAYYIDDPASEDNGKIYVDTLDNYYSDAVNNKLGGLIDLDKYLDVTEHTVNSVLPFTDINFNYQDTKVVLMENHFEQFNEVFGDAEFNVRRAFPDEIDRGTKYEIEVPFSHMKYERIVDSGFARDVTDIQWGYCATGDFNETDGDTTVIPNIPPKGDYDTITIKPLLFYGINETSITTPINFIFFDDNGIPSVEAVVDYWRPSNANDTGDASTPPSYTLNFDQEYDEWLTINFANNSNSLYNIFYKNYVESVFNPAKRMFKVTAYLPPNILINYRLNDQIKIQDKIFRINSITTNLMDGKSELELLNIFSNEIVE